MALAWIARTAVVEAGRQAALMAPTEILARQHHRTLAMFGEAAGLRLALVTGRDTAASRDKTLARARVSHLHIAISAGKSRA
jgi:ATP-dependent DNA helicase RecG